VLTALVAQHIQHGGGVLHQLLAVLFLAVQHTQGVAVKAGLAGGAHFANAVRQVLLQHGVILGPALGAADGVDIHGKVLHAQLAQQAEGGHDQLRVGSGVLGAEALHAKLVVLTQAAVLGRFITEDGSVEVVHLAGQRVSVKAVLHQGANSAGGAFGLQGNGAVALVLEGVHFLLHDVGGVAHAAQEQFRVLEHGGADLTVAGLGGNLTFQGFYILEAVAVLGQHILCAAGSLSQHGISLLIWYPA